jgi:hypothetical protein
VVTLTEVGAVLPGDVAGLAGVVLARAGLPLVAAVGLILVGVGVVILLAASDGLDRRMPNQVLPRRFARYPLVAGAVLLGAAAMLWLLP